LIVVDASAIIEILLKTRLAERCQYRIFDSQEQICAPFLLDIEVIQVLQRYALKCDITPERGNEALEDYIDFPIVRYPHEPLLPRVWELRNNLTAYDATYISLAELLKAPLITCDYKIAGAHGYSAAVEVIQ
jgi:predicted nucleic acid-binding protein